MDNTSKPQLPDEPDNVQVSVETVESRTIGARPCGQGQSGHSFAAISHLPAVGGHAAPPASIAPCSETAAAMRVASLAAVVIANGWADDSFARLIATLDYHFPPQFGDMNHSRSFLNGFRRSMVSEL